MVTTDIKNMNPEQLKLKIIELANMYRSERLKTDEI